VPHFAGDKIPRTTKFKLTPEIVMRFPRKRAAAAKNSLRRPGTGTIFGWI